MKIKCSDLVGAQLDYAVAKCSGPTMMAFFTHNEYTPSTDWEQGGPIIEREECIATTERLNCGGEFRVQMPYDRLADRPGRYFYGPTPLIAAMRCYVASKLGDEVEIPEKLK